MLQNVFGREAPTPFATGSKPGPAPSFPTSRAEELALTLAACTYSAPDYPACDPDRPSELVSVSTFEGPLEGMEAIVADVIAEIEAEHDAYAYVADDRTRPQQRPDDAVTFGLTVEVDDEATFIPASEGCEVDRLELSATTRVSAPGGEEATGIWEFSLSRDTAEEASGGLNEQQARALLEAIGTSYEGSEVIDVSLGVRFVDNEDRGRATFPGTGVIATRGDPNTPSTVLAQFAWEPASD